MAVAALTPEEFTAEFFLEVFDGFGQSRLGNVANLRRPGEV